jgi:hypothetical protein
MKLTKLTLLAIAVVSPLIAYGAIIVTTPNPVQPASAASETYPTSTEPVNGGCPTGSYNIGTKDGVNPICKLEPTGCPFGDSVPMDKCTPPPDITCNADWSKCEPKIESEPINVPTPTNDTRSTSGQEEQPSGCFSSK